jgi:hypothetical protein
VRISTIALAVGFAGTIACKRSEPAPRLEAPAKDGSVVTPPLAPAFERAPLTVVARIAELCEPVAVVEFLTAISGRPAGESGVVAEAIEPPASPGACGLVLGPNLVDYVGVIPQARLRNAPPEGHVDAVTARVSGDAVVVGRARALDELATLPPLLEWAGMVEVAAEAPDAWANGLARFDVGAPIGGQKFEPKIELARFAVEERAFVLEARGDQDVLDMAQADLQAELERLAGLSTAGRLGALLERDPVAGLVLPLGLADAVAAGRVHFEPSPNVLRIRLDLEGTDATKAALLLGIVSALFGPTTSKYHRRMQTAEPRIFLARMYDGIVAAMYEDPQRPSTFRGCPIAQPQIGWTPSLDLACTTGPGGRCTIGDDRPAAYSPEVWTSKGWTALGFAVSEAHRFHYNFRATYIPDAHGCQFTAQAFGDLDGDGLFSTFERAGAADRVGVNAPGLYIDNEVE